MFVKLFSKILQSSVWAEDHATVRIWVTLLLLADKQGIVQGSAPGLSITANSTLAETRAALKILEAPDLDSGSPTYGGRRIEKVEGGWILLNHEKYREIRTEEQLKAAARQRKQYHRDRETSREVDDSYTEAEADTEAEVPTKKNRLVDEQPSSTLPVPTSKKALVAKTVVEALGNLALVLANKKQLRTAQIYALFSYYMAKTGKRPGSTNLDLDRYNRLGRCIDDRGIEFALYVVDGGMVHRDLNQDDRTLHEVSNFFPVKHANDRWEKLVSVTRWGHEKHRLLVKHPELEGQIE